MCNCLLLILCILLPPLAVLFRQGCTIHVCINLLLTCLAWIPGMIHAVYVCFYMVDSSTQTQPPPEKKPRIDDPQKQEEYFHPDVALQSQEMAEDESQQEEIDEAAVKRLCIQLEQRKAKNAEMRIKYAEDPQKFMESEVELNTAIQEMHVITTKPQFYHILVEHGTVQTLLQLVGHDNADIIAAVCNLLQELTDIDMLHEEDVKLLVDELLDGRIVETLVQQALIKLDEKEQDESDTVHNILTIFENLLLSSHPESNEICVSQGLFEWLMTRGTKKGAFDANKRYSSELLSMLLQNTELARKKLTERDGDGIDLLLRTLTDYQRHDPGSLDENKHMENLFNALGASLLYTPNRQIFLDDGGLQLMNLMMEKKQSREGALNVLYHATLILDGVSICDEFVEILDLHTLFQIYLDKDKSLPGHTRSYLAVYCCRVIDALLFTCSQTNRQKVLRKFVDDGFEKVVRTVELFLKYRQKLEFCESKMTKNQNGEWSEESNYQRLDYGLGTLQPIALILAEVCINGSPGCREKAENQFKLENEEPSLQKHLIPVLKEFHKALGPEPKADIHKQRVERLIASLSSPSNWFAKFLRRLYHISGQSAPPNAQFQHAQCAKSTSSDPN